MAADDYAVVVGISYYPDEDLGELKGPENDARSFYEWLVDPQGGAVPQLQVTLILSSQYDRSPQRRGARPVVQDINNAFERLIEQGDNNGGRVGRRLYIFLAGHGFSPILEEAALLMANAGTGYMGYHVPGRRYALWFIASALFDEVILFMDCCRDDYPTVSVSSLPWEERHSEAAYKVRHLYGFATDWSRKSRERTIPDVGEVRGVFTWSLLKGLKGAAGDDQGRITGLELKKFIHNFMPTLISTDEYQRPNIDGGEDIVFAQGLPLKRTLVRITFGQLNPNEAVDLYGPMAQLLGQHFPKEGIWEIPLEKGLYRLFIPGTGEEHYLQVLGEEAKDIQLGKEGHNG
jgi:hypothetical protein